MPGLTQAIVVVPVLEKDITVVRCGTRVLAEMFRNSIYPAMSYGDENLWITMWIASG
jgi:hypothetical protein